MKQFIWTIYFTGLVLQCFGQTVKNEFYERIYLQTDKQLYLAGESIHLKVLTVDPELIPIVFSKIVYAELVDSVQAHIQIKMALSHGIGKGVMQIPSDLPTGVYRLIAYTQFMRNEGSGVFFEKMIGVVNTFQPDYYPREQQVDTENYPAAGRQSGYMTLFPDKTIYSNREHGELTITGLPDNIHSLSVSITGKEMFAVDKTDQGLPQQMKPPQPTVFTGEYLPEYEGHIITGKIINNQTGQEATNNLLLTTGLSFPGKELRFFPGQNTETGLVRFFTSGITGTKEVATIVYYEDKKYRLDVISPFVTYFSPQKMPVIHIDSADYDQLLARSVALQVSHYFMDNPNDTPVGQGSMMKLIPTNSYLLDEYTRFTTMREVFTEFISNARFRRRSGKWELSLLVKEGYRVDFGNDPLVLLDGAPVSDHELIYHYDPLSVEQINIYNEQYHFGGRIIEGIIELKTYRGLLQDLNFDKSTQITPYEGPQTYQQPEIPDYSIANNRMIRMPDRRHTLLWEPDIQTDGQSTIRVPFNTSDLTGDYQATVEGITKDGQVVFSTTSLKVEQKK